MQLNGCTGFSTSTLYHNHNHNHNHNVHELTWNIHPSHGDLKLGLKYIKVLVLLYCRNAGPINDSDEPTDYEECNDFREPLLNFASNNDS